MAAPTQPTVLDALLASLAKAADHNRDDTVPPAAVLWPDEKRDWERLVPRIRAALPNFLVFGPYDPANRTGPAIWLRCVLAGMVGQAFQPDAAVGQALQPDAGVRGEASQAGKPNLPVPIIYLPGVSRATLRATEECPNELKPLAELQYRGVFWSQVNARDWTVAAFLQTNHGGLQLKIAKDQATASAIRRAIDKLADVPVADLQTQSAAGELNSQFFNLLISDDPVDDLLTWLADPQATRQRWDADRWEAMCGDSVKNYGFDPARDGPLVGAERLGLQEKNVWKTAWKRFTAAPGRYPGLVEQLRRAKPQPKGATKGQPLFQDAEEFWPQDNEAAEAELRRSLPHVASASPSEARQMLAELEKRHKQRRDWVWARLSLTPLANALKHLAELSRVTETPMTGAATDDLVRTYTSSGWRADAAVLDALAAVSHSRDREVICGAISQVYSPWLRDAAELFQEWVKHQPLPGRDVPRLSEVPSGTCVLFADGLRYDIGQKLKAALEAKLGRVQLRHQFVALPSVTPTAKPAVSPVADKLKGTTAGEEFLPCLAIGEKGLTTERFRKLLEDDDYQVLGLGETGEPTGRAWTEFGSLDKTGHHEGIGLALRIAELLATLTQRVESLLAAGWGEVRIVTDHGWLLVPNGLPKSDLPKYLTATRWGRCAVVKPSATVQLPCFSWFWADDVRIACPGGIDSFIAGKKYSHGGLSLQECVVPQLIIQAGSASAVSARIESYKWAGLRLRIKVEGGFENCMVDLRDKAADPASSLSGAKSVGKDGSVALVVENDARDGTAAILVLFDPAGNILEKTPVTVGG